MLPFPSSVSLPPDRSKPQGASVREVQDEPEAQQKRRLLEAEFTDLLNAMFSPEELYRFLRHRINIALADALPRTENQSAIGYAASAAEALVARNALDASFFEALTTERGSRRDEIHEFANRFALLDEALHSAASIPHYRDDETRELSRKIQAAQERKLRLMKAGRNTIKIDQEILTLKRILRRGGQVREGDMLGRGRYLVLEMLGRGGFATVWRSLDKERDMEVAIKILHSNLAADSIRRDRFFRGARIMSNMNQSGVIQVIEPHGSDDGYHYFVMELATGGTLRQAITHDRIPKDQRIPLIIRLGRTLAVAHEHGYIHRDVKPANVLIAEGGEPRLTDFDLVAAADTSGGTRTGALGTFVYAAPEQLNRPQDVDVRADIYSLAMTAVFVFHGQELPITVVRDAPTFLRQLDCPPAIADTLERALNWEPDNRFATMREFCDTLAKARKWELSLQIDTRLGRRRVDAEVGLTRVLVPWGRFVMGSSEDDVLAKDDERPSRNIEIGGFWITETPITNQQYRWYVDKTGNESGFWTDKRYNGENQPVIGVTWYNAVEFCNHLSTRCGLTLCYDIHGTNVTWNRRANGYRLPTEAEWEFACRAGTNSRWFFGDDEAMLSEYACFGETDGLTQPVASKQPNPWGLFDMLGNTHEWCWDWYARYRGTPLSDGVRNPGGPVVPPPVELWDPNRKQTIKCGAKVLRGGSYRMGADALRPASRSKDLPESWHGVVGFRCARNV